MKIIKSRNKREGHYAGRRRRQYDHSGGTRHYREGEPLPYGMTISYGQLMAQCRSCDCRYPWEHGKDDFDLENSYCGGNPRCCP